ncbi:MAG TPA: phage holin family protein [Solirubrobacteraceae bacterium]|nr:phage holin family protein [Solirubrobacteraceae bacterium]
MNDGPNPPPRRDGRQQGIAAAITEVSERASLLIREEIELAKTEVTEKATRLAKGAIVAIVAGVFFFTALFFVLIGCAWLLYFELPIGNQFTYFWGFFAMALILVVLGVLAGLLAYRAVKAGAPPTPDMAIAEARKIRETVSSSAERPVPATAPAPAPASPSPVTSSSPPPPPVPPPGPASDTDLGRGSVDGTTLGS